jgi:hypothetical protein
MNYDSKIKSSTNRRWQNVSGKQRYKQTKKYEIHIKIFPN